MLITATDKPVVDARKDRRLRAVYRRELEHSVRRGAMIYVAFVLPVILLNEIGNPAGARPILVVGGVAVVIGLLIAYLVRHGGRRYVTQLGMVLGLLPLVTAVMPGARSADLVAIAIAGCGMIPLAFALFVPLDRLPYRIWMALADVVVVAIVVVPGPDSPMAVALAPLATTMAMTTVLSVAANEILVRRRDESNKQVLASRAIQQRMQEREADLRRQDEFLMMQQETLVVQQAELLRLNEELETIARIDALTGLGNRLRLNEDLAQLAGRIERGGGSAGLLLLDLDRFKRLNDTCGHLAGDAALKGVAEVLRRTARVGDGLYRYGGEEFLIVLHDCDERTLELAGQRYISAVQAAGMAHPDNQPWGVVTTSAGAAELSQRVGVDVDAALRAADEALYQAKELGRNRLEVHVHLEPEVVPIERAAS